MTRSRFYYNCVTHPDGPLDYVTYRIATDTHVLQCRECGTMVEWPVTGSVADRIQNGRKHRRNVRKAAGGLRDRAHGGATSVESRMGKHANTGGRNG